MTTGHSVETKEFLAKEPRPCRHMPLLVHFGGARAGPEGGGGGGEAGSRAGGPGEGGGGRIILLYITLQHSTFILHLLGREILYTLTLYHNSSFILRHSRGGRSARGAGPGASRGGRQREDEEAAEEEAPGPRRRGARAHGAPAGGPQARQR